MRVGLFPCINFLAGCLPLCLALSPLVDWDKYEQGALGVNPETTFHTTNFRMPLVHVETESKACQSNNEFIFLTPRAERDSGNKAVILDQRGQLVWYKQERGAVFDLRTQKFKGNDYITYWVGNDDFGGHGAGYYKMLDRKYQLAYAIAACNNVSGDYHEFSITKDDTALIIAYESVPADLTQFGREDGYILDCIFQEIGIETNKLLFEWRASHHFGFADMAVSSWNEYTGTADNPWDWFHLNSVEKDDKGNYLIAARYTNAVTYISGKTGAFLWNLGGKLNNFKDKSQDSATRFVDPHMARRTHGSRGITLFDNVAFWSLDSPRRVSRGIEIYINEQVLEARVTKEFVHPKKLFGLSEGSMQPLANGNFFIGYGSLPVYSEFSASGKLLCNTHFSPQNASKAPDAQGYLQSYRTYKSPWAGEPDNLPVVRIVRDTMYISWNGASTVHWWQLSGSHNTRLGPRSSTFIGKFKKDGFETTVDLQDASYLSFKLTALESDGYKLGQWHVHDDETITELTTDLSDVGRLSSLWSHPLFMMITSWALVLVFKYRRLLYSIRAAPASESLNEKWRIP